MKIKLLTLLLAIVCAGSLQAQTEFAPIGATWYHGRRESMQSDMGFVKTTVTDTTVIDGKNVKILYSEYHWSNGQVTPRDTIYAYQTGDSVLFYLDGDFHLVYNFGLNVGDTMKIYNPDNKYCGAGKLYGHVVVKSIKTLEINGNRLKEFKFSTADSDIGYYNYIEKIGTINQMFGSDCIADDFGAGIFGWLRCYEDSEIGHYQYGSEPCDSLYVFDWDAYYRWEDSVRRVGIIDKESLDLKLFYSHAEQAIIVDTRGGCGQSVIKVFDVNGSIVYDDICEPEKQTRVAIKRSGVYVIFIINNIGTYYEKIIAY